MTRTSFAIALSVSIILATAVLAPAKTIKIPEDKPVISVNVPDSWAPEATDKGIVIESSDKVATVIFEVTSPRELKL
jgi:hypothetical protein